MTADDFWRAIGASPEDESIRSVFADWLLERSDPLGEFIQLQLTPTPSKTTRAQALLRKHWKRWLGGLARVLEPGTTRFERGVLVHASVGRTATPPQAFRSDSPLLATVQRVLPHYVKPRDYGAFLANEQLKPRQIGFDSYQTIAHLGGLGRKLGFREAVLLGESKRSDGRNGFRRVRPETVLTDLRSLSDSLDSIVLDTFAVRQDGQTWIDLAACVLRQELGLAIEESYEGDAEQFFRRLPTSVQSLARERIRVVEDSLSANENAP